MSFKCVNCELGSDATYQLFPIGSIEPTYYILGESANSTEEFNKTTFDTGNQANRYAMNILETMNINKDNSRFFKLLRCCPKSRDNLVDNINKCSIYAMMDIYKTKPKIVICLGQEVTRYMLGDRFKSMSQHRGRLYDVSINGEVFKVMPTHSPDYLLYKKDFELGEQFLSDITFATKYVGGDLSGADKKDLQSVRNYTEFMDYFNEHLANCSTPSFDLETNAHDSRSETARMVGFSLANDTGTTGVYVLRESLDYKMPEEDWNKIVEHTKDYLSKCKTRVHNSMYEVQFTYNEWGYLIENFDDTLVMARMLLGGKTGAGLKEQCISQLGYPDWDKDLGDFLSAIRKLIAGLKPTTTSVRWDHKVLLSQGLIGLRETYNEKANSLDKRSTECAENLEKLVNVISRYYYNEGELEHILSLLQVELLSLIEARFTGMPSYGIVPSKIITAYGAMDAVATQDLYRHLCERMDKESSELGIDLFKGYNYWKGHFTVASFMEMSGIFWDDDIANELETWYSDECIRRMNSMIDSGFMDDYIFNEHKYLLVDYVREEALDEVYDILGNFTPMKSCIKLEDGNKITWKNLVEELDKRTNNTWSNSKKSVVMDMVRDKMKEHTYYLDYKWIFNPVSPSQKVTDLLNDILIDQDIKLAYFLAQLQLLMDNPEFNISRYPLPDRRLFEIIQESRDYNSRQQSEEEETDEEIVMKYFSDDIDEFDEESQATLKIPKITSKLVLDKFKEIIPTMQFRSTEIGNLLGKSLNYKLESGAETNIIELNNYYLLLGIDVEDDSTYTPQYQWLYDYRMWKKCNKMIATYINGNKIGRGQVKIVNKESLMRGDTLSRRIGNYYDRPIDRTKECHIMQSSFRVCNAETGRWQTGMHTIPSGGEIKNIYTSRFDNGVIAMPDYSAMEVRVIAGASGCEPMLKVFREGGDIHTMNASLVFDKPPEEISSEERRYSKMATFSLLYGADYKSFGTNFLDGDIPRAKAIYENFFRAFPEIKTWIDKRHEEMRTTGKVTTMTDRYINVSPSMYKGDENKALRSSQNYPIQGSGSDMAGYILYKIHDFIRSNNFHSKVVLFIHDSLEVDVHPDEFLAIGAQIVPLMNQFPMEEWGMVTAADLAIGASLGQELEIKKLETDEKFNCGEFIMEGYDDCIQPVLDRWKKQYKIVEFEDVHEPKQVYVPKSNLFIPKLAFSKFMGQHRVKRELKFKLKIK